MIKVAHMTSVHKENDNRIFYKEVSTLSRNGYKVVLIVAGATSRKLNNDIEILGYPKAQGRFKRFLQNSLLDIVNISKKLDADIYHFHDPELIFAGLYLKIKGKKVIYDIHENNPASILSKPYIKSKYIRLLLSKLFDVFEKVSVPFFDALVTARPDISMRFNHKNIVTLRNFPILGNIQRHTDISISKEKPAVIYVGGLHSIRGIHQLLDAFESLDEYELWLLGPIVDDTLQKRLSQNPKNCRYFGVVEPYEVFSYIKQADIGIITFLNKPNHINTLATKPFEYMACGKPMIVSNFPYWRETFKKSALYVDPANAKEIAATVRKLLADKDLMEKMGKLNEELSKLEYNWEKESQKLINLYRKLSK